jgi:hypothetical protein
VQAVGRRAPLRKQVQRRSAVKTQLKRQLPIASSIVCTARPAQRSTAQQGRGLSAGGRQGMPLPRSPEGACASRMPIGV